MLTRGGTTIVLSLLLIAGAAVPVSAEPRRYTVTDLGTLGGPGGTTAAAMNDSGAVVGTSDAWSARHAFLWRGGVMTDLGTLPGASRSEAYGINENGVVAGTSYRPTGEPRAVLWRDGRIKDLGLPHSHGLAVNDSGQVLALTTAAGGLTSRVLWKNGQVTDLGPENDYQAAQGDLNNRAFVTMRFRGDPAGPWHAGFQQYGWTREYGPLGGGADDVNEAADINNRNVMVGSSEDGQGRIRPVDFDGPHGDLGTLGGPDGAATVINDRDVVAGHADTAAGDSRPVLWKDGRIIDLTTRGVPATAVIVDLNRPGQMIASDGYRAIFIG
jgi:probable HAF family extracellular repeat protein